MALMSVVLMGVPEFVGALENLQVYATLAARRAVTFAGTALEAEAKKTLTTSSHAKGTPTPAAPGQPPSLITGQLRRSIKLQRSHLTGPGQWSAKVGPTAVYGRIQELGGTAGRGSVLPARPYLEPSLRRLIDSGRLEAIYAEAWRAALAGIKPGA